MKLLLLWFLSCGKRLALIIDIFLTAHSGGVDFQKLGANRMHKNHEEFMVHTKQFLGGPDERLTIHTYSQIFVSQVH